MDDVTLERQITEYECLKLFNSIVPGSVPEPYCLDINTHISKNLRHSNQRNPATRVLECLILPLENLLIYYVLFHSPIEIITLSDNVLLNSS